MNEWSGFVAVDVVPSPKSQSLAVIGEVPSVEASVNCTESGGPPLSGVPEKAAAGTTGTIVALMYAAFVSVVEPTPLVAVSDTAYTPRAV